MFFIRRKKKIIITSQSIKIGDFFIEYKLRQANDTKRLVIKIDGNGDLKVSSPLRFPIYKIENFIKQKSLWIIQQTEIAKQREANKKKFTPDQIKEYKKITKLIVAKRIIFFSQYYNLAPKKIVIRNQKSRWGSCSRKGNLNFNYKIALIPSHLQDYIIVHELCHLAQFNHSPKFWQLVGLTIPNYLECRRELRRLTFE